MAKGVKTGGGNRKGKPNKFTKSVKDVLNATFTELQTDPKANLKAWAKNNPTEFYKLCGKLIPAAVDVTSGGDKIPFQAPNIILPKEDSQ